SSLFGTKSHIILKSYETNLLHSELSLSDIDSTPVLAQRLLLPFFLPSYKLPLMPHNPEANRRTESSRNDERTIEVSFPDQRSEQTMLKFEKVGARLVWNDQ